MGKKLYVGNLGYKVGSSDLEQLFSSFGTVQSAQVIEDRETSRSKGFGFVEMGSDQEAQAAIQGLNGKDHEGRPLTVNEAKNRARSGQVGDTAGAVADTVGVEAGEGEADGTEAASTLFGGAPRDQSVGRELTVNRLTVLT